MSLANGTPSTAKPATPAQVRRELREAQAEQQLYVAKLKLLSLKRAERVRSIQESADQWDYLNTYQDMIDRARSPDGVLLTPLSTAADRKYGANWPFWRTWQDHAKLRGISRILYGMSHQAEGALSGLQSYVVGSGFTYRAAAKQKMTVGDDILGAVQTVLDDFSDINGWPALEQELFIRDHRDGEHFRRYFPHEDYEGMTIVRTVEPEFVVEPAEIAELMDKVAKLPLQTVLQGADYSGLAAKSFGVITPPDDVQNPLAYWVSYEGSASTGEEVPHGEMHHRKIGVDRAIKRGKPDFVFDTYDAFKTAVRALQGMGEATAIQANIAMIVQHTQATGDQVGQFNDAVADYQRPNPFNGKNQDVARINSGTRIDIDKGQEYVVPPFGQNAQYFVPVIQALLRNAGVKWNAPEWLTSGDASNNNYSSSITAESPFVKNCKQMQDFCKGDYKRMMMRVLKNYCEAKKGLPIKGGRRIPWEQLKNIIDIQVEAPTIEVRNKAEEAQENQAYVTMGAKSIQTVSQQQGLDYEQEQQNREEYQERTGGNGLGLELPPEDPKDPNNPKKPVVDPALKKPGAQAA